MKSKSQWTEEEDKFLKQEVDKNGKKSWVLICTKLNTQFPNKTRTAKQCRQRYINHLLFCDQNENSNIWTEEQIIKLFKIFVLIGPKWSTMANEFHGKTENSLKNKFYGSVRKLVRQLNIVQKQQRKKKINQLKYESIFRILQAPDSIKNLKQQFKEKALYIRKQIVQALAVSPFPREKKIQLIQNINKFNRDSRNYKQQRYKVNREKMVSYPSKFNINCNDLKLNKQSPNIALTLPNLETYSLPQQYQNYNSPNYSCNIGLKQKVLQSSNSNHSLVKNSYQNQSFINNLLDNDMIEKKVSQLNFQCNKEVDFLFQQQSNNILKEFQYI